MGLEEPEMIFEEILKRIEDLEKGLVDDLTDVHKVVQDLQKRVCGDCGILKESMEKEKEKEKEKEEEKKEKGNRMIGFTTSSMEAKEKEEEKEKEPVEKMETWKDRVRGQPPGGDWFRFSQHGGGDY